MGTTGVSTYRVGKRLVTIGLLLFAGLLLVFAGSLVWFPRKPAVPEPATRPGVSTEETPLVLGQRLYGNYCAQCHGEQGGGDGLAARFLYPKPRNFRDGRFRVVTTDNLKPSDQDLLHVITRGMPGSAMFPFAHLSEAERQALVAYVRYLNLTAHVEHQQQEATTRGERIDVAELTQEVQQLLQPGATVDVPSTLPPFGAESVARGHQLYTAQCVSCHGPTGKGDGVEEQRDDSGMPIRPRDFTRGIFKGGRERQQLYARIVLGMPGTPMPASSKLQPNEVGDLINFVLSLSDPAVQAKVEHKRSQIVAKRVAGRLADEMSDEVWSANHATTLVVSPLWWRNYTDPELQVQAVHDGTALAIRLSWKDPTRNEQTYRPEDFEDMAAIQLFKGSPEPFLGMGSEAGPLDLWQWRASWQRQVAEGNNLLDDYPFDTPLYRQLIKGKEKQTPDFLTARAAGNLHTHPEPKQNASSLTAKGFGSTTFRPKASQLVTARSTWQDGRWTVVLRRPLLVGPEDGIALTVGDLCAVAFALWDGEARDRNGQKLISIWHDLIIE